MAAITTENPLTKYKAELDVWPTLKTPYDVIHHHDNLVSTVAQCLPKDDSKDIELKLNSYRNYVFELLETKQTNPSAKGSLTLSIEFGDTQVKIGMHDEIGLSFYYNRSSSTYPGNAIKSRDILLGYLMKIPKLNLQIDYRENEALNALLKWCRNYFKKEKQYGRVLISIPSSLGFKSREVLRDAAHSAEFTNCHLFTESSLAAFTILTKASNPYPMVVVITAGITGLEVAFYTFIFKTVKMVALDKYEWDLNDSDIEVKGCAPFCRGNKLKRAMESQDNKLNILVRTYDKAVAQLNDQMKEQKRKCVFLTESPKWNEAFQQFQEMSRELKVVQLEEDASLLALMRLSKSSPEKIFQYLQDHVIPFTEGKDLQPNSDASNES